MARVNSFALLILLAITALASCKVGVSVFLPETHTSPRLEYCAAISFIQPTKFTACIEIASNAGEIDDEALISSMNTQLALSEGTIATISAHLQAHTYAPLLSSSTAYAKQKGVTFTSLQSLSPDDLTELLTLGIALHADDIHGSTRVLFTDLRGVPAAGADIIILCSFADPVDMPTTGFGVWSIVADTQPHLNDTTGLSAFCPAPEAPSAGARPLSFFEPWTPRGMTPTDDEVLLDGNTADANKALAYFYQQKSDIYAVRDVINSFPRMLRTIRNTKMPMTQMPKPVESLSINGVALDHYTATMHDILQEVTEEVALDNYCALAGLADCRPHIRLDPTRLDFRPFETAIRWEIDVETSMAYRRAPTSIKHLDNTHPIRRNAMNVVLFVDPKSATGLSSLAQIYNIFKRSPPWHLGLVFSSGLENPLTEPDSLFEVGGVPRLRGESRMHAVTDDLGFDSAFETVGHTSASNPMGEMVSRYFLAISDVIDTNTAFTWASILYGHAESDHVEIDEMMISDAVSDLITRFNRPDSINEDILAERAHSSAISRELRAMAEATRDLGLNDEVARGPVAVINGRVVASSERPIETETFDAVSREINLLSSMVKSGVLTDAMLDAVACEGSLCFLSSVFSLPQIKPEIVSKYHPVSSIFDRSEEQVHDILPAQLSMPDSKASTPPLHINVAAPFASHDSMTRYGAARLAIAVVRGVFDAQPLDEVTDVRVSFANTAAPTRVPRMLEQLLAHADDSIRVMGPAAFVQALAWTAGLDGEDVDADSLAMALGVETVGFDGERLKALPRVAHAEFHLSIAGFGMDLTESDAGSLRSGTITGAVRSYVEDLMQPILDLTTPSKLEDAKAEIDTIVYKAYKRATKKRGFLSAVANLPRLTVSPPVAGTPPIVKGVIDPFTEHGRRIINVLADLDSVVRVDLTLSCPNKYNAAVLPSFYTYYGLDQRVAVPSVKGHRTSVKLDVAQAWVTHIQSNDGIDTESVSDSASGVIAHALSHFAVESHAIGRDSRPVSAIDIQLIDMTGSVVSEAASILYSPGYFQHQVAPGVYTVQLGPGRAQEFAVVKGLTFAVTTLASVKNMHLHLRRLPNGVVSSTIGDPTTPHVALFHPGFAAEEMALAQASHIMSNSKSRVVFWVDDFVASPQFVSALTKLCDAKSCALERSKFRWPAFLDSQYGRPLRPVDQLLAVSDLIFPPKTGMALALGPNLVLRDNVLSVMTSAMHTALFAAPPMCAGRADGPKPYWIQGRWAARKIPFVTDELVMVDVTKAHGMHVMDDARLLYHRVAPSSTGTRDLLNHHSLVKILESKWSWSAQWCEEVELAGAKGLIVPSNAAAVEVEEWVAAIDGLKEICNV
ncbi:Prokaryotic membrane lipoprotein lipid attachment site [Carpediemonas membranifera]|uniref:Prokaryotic membrane lipoprotein lipid attachment site n=1 Tax=Carpediemonas membranifera TaxID=201153 RepID=A0A8J6E9J3_9EUKA|nr:Prokaryotic membrane lipoprotein lipid attachment site [Carpediemonas membranifera]|eukprot:KAG9393430.1 Prokaryotic membrane lipoprotein lipid attachment site [Carpediemonas membranifera]